MNDRRELPGQGVTVLVAREERLDGTGGAVATWVDRVQARVPETLAVVGMPVASQGEGMWLARIDAVLNTVSQIFGRLTSTNPKRWERALWLRDFWYVVFLYRRLRKSPAIYIHNRPRYAGFVRFLGYRGKVLVHMHNDPLSYFAPLGRRAIARIDEFVFCSEFIRRRAVELCGIPWEKSSVILNGVDDIPIDTHMAPMAPRLLFVGRLQDYKGVDVAIDATRLLLDNGVPASLTIIGGSDLGLRGALTDYVRDLKTEAGLINERFGPGSVIFRGPLPLEEVLREMQRHPILLFPSRVEEAFGMVLAEAISRGCFAVTSNRGGIPEVVSIAGQGFIVGDIDEKAFSQAVLRALQEITEADRQEAASRILDRLSWKRIRADYRSQILGKSTLRN